MKLEQLKQLFVGQRFIFKYEVDSYNEEVFELHILEIDGQYVKCRYKYLEAGPRSYAEVGDAGETMYHYTTLDEMIHDGYNEQDGWRLLGFHPIKPLNALPEELFVI